MNDNVCPRMAASHLGRYAVEQLFDVADLRSEEGILRRGCRPPAGPIFEQHLGSDTYLSDCDAYYPGSSSAALPPTSTPKP